MPRIAYTGTRRGMKPVQTAQFRRFVEMFYLGPEATEYVWHDGDCIGGDDEAHQIVAQIKLELGQQRRFLKMIGHPGDTPQYYASNVFDESREVKGNIPRNHDMVDEVEILIACPGERDEVQRSGTWSTIRYARKVKKQGRQLDLIIIYPNGAWERV